MKILNIIKNIFNIISHVLLCIGIIVMLIGAIGMMRGIILGINFQQIFIWYTICMAGGLLALCSDLFIVLLI